MYCCCCSVLPDLCGKWQWVTGQIGSDSLLVAFFHLEYLFVMASIPAPDDSADSIAMPCYLGRFVKGWLQ